MRLSPIQFSRQFLLHCRQGGGLPVVIILLALALSVGVFFFFTRPAMKENAAQETKSSQAIKAQAPAETATANRPVAAVAATSETKPTAPPAPAKPVFGFARPLDLGKDLARSLNSGDFTRAGALVTAADPSQTALATSMFEHVLKSLKAKVGTEDQIELLGQVENRTRLAIPFTLPGSESPARLQLDIERDEKMGWKVTRLQLPQAMQPALAAAGEAKSEPAQTSPAPPSPPTMAKAGQAIAVAPPSSAAPASKSNAAPKLRPKTPLITVEAGPDALTFGSDFVRALLKHDFTAAREFVDEKKVPAERLAGLCIVFEEGAYEFKPQKPMIITVANPEVSWIIAQVQSPSLQQSTEFGLELQRSGVDRPWKVVGLNLSEILSSFASSAAKLGVPYTPIVKNPRGGESLAIYFEYDQAELHPRALKQLEIVSGMLKADPDKKLQIAGHTDAKGTDNYNITLSQARAEYVKQKLVALGVSEDQISTQALGKAQPLGPNLKADGTDDPEGRSKNRRAEIYLDF